LNVTDTEHDDTKLSSGSLAQFYDVAVPSDQNDDDPDTTQPSEDELDPQVDSTEDTQGVENQKDVARQSPTISPPVQPESSEPCETPSPATAVDDNDTGADDGDYEAPIDVPTQPSRPAPTPPTTRPTDNQVLPARPKQPELFEVDTDGVDGGDVVPEDDFPIYDLVEVSSLSLILYISCLITDLIWH